MAENMVEKSHFLYSPDIPTGASTGGTPSEMKSSEIPNGILSSLVQDSPFFEKEGYRKIVDYLPDLTKIQTAKKIKAEIKEENGVIDYSELDKKLREKMGGSIDEATKKEIEGLLNKELFIKNEIGVESILATQESLFGLDWAIKESKNFRKLNWQATSIEGTLDHNIRNVSKARTEAELRGWMSKENKVLLTRLKSDVVYLRAKYQFLEHFNPFIYNYHDAMRILGTLKLLERQCPDSSFFVTCYQKDEKKYKVEEKDKDLLPPELQEGIREKCMDFEDDSQDLIFMNAFAGQIIWEDEDILKVGSTEKYIKTTDLDQFSLTQLRFMHDIFGVYDIDKEGKRVTVPLKEVYIDPHLRDKDLKMLKDPYLMVKEVRDDLKLEIPKEMLNWFSMDQTDENQNKYTAKMVACLLLKAKDKLYNIDPDFTLKERNNAYPEVNYNDLVSEVNLLADQIEEWGFDPELEYESKNFSQFGTLDLLLAKMIVETNIQEAWAFLYAGKLASELKYKQQELDWMNGKDTKEEIFWVRKQEIGTLHAASDMGDMYHRRRRAAKYKFANREMGYILPPDSRESRVEYLYEHRADWVLPIDRYITNPDGIKGEKYDSELDYWLKMSFGHSKEAHEYRKSLGLEIDVKTGQFLMALCHAEETPYLIEGKASDPEDKKKRLALPDFSPYPLNEFNVWDTFTLDNDEYTKLEDGTIVKNEKQSVYYRMVKDRREKSSFDFHKMEKNLIDFHNVTMDQLTNVMTLYYDTPSLDDVDKMYFANVGLIRTLIKRVDLGMRSNKFHIVEIPELKPNSATGELDYVKDENGKINMLKKKVPVEIYEMGWVPTMLSHHLAKVYNIIGVGGMQEKNVNNFLMEMSEFITMIMYLNPEKKVSKDYKNAMQLTCHLFSILLSRAARISGIQDSQDVSKNYTTVFDRSNEEYSKAGISEKKMEKSKEQYKTYQTKVIPFRKA